MADNGGWSWFGVITLVLTPFAAVYFGAYYTTYTLCVKDRAEDNIKLAHSLLGIYNRRALFVQYDNDALTPQKIRILVNPAISFFYKEFENVDIPTIAALTREMAQSWRLLGGPESSKPGGKQLPLPPPINTTLEFPVDLRSPGWNQVFRDFLVTYKEQRGHQDDGSTKRWLSDNSMYLEIPNFNYKGEFRNFLSRINAIEDMHNTLIGAGSNVQRMAAFAEQNGIIRANCFCRSFWPPYKD